MNDSRSFMIVMFALSAFLCLMVGRSIHMVYNEDTTTPAQDYQDTMPTAPANARILDLGYDYVGTCQFIERDDGGHGDTGCDAGSEARMCGPYLHQQFPQLAGPGPADATARRLSDDESLLQDEDVHAEERRLRGHGHGHSTSCYNMYAPWLLVRFTVNGTQVDRCSYRYGTKANSQTLVWNYVRDQQESHWPNDTIPVLVSNISGSCVVAYENYTILDTYIDHFTHGKEAIVPLYWLFFVCGAVALVQMVRWMFFKEDPPEGEDAKKGKDADEEEELSEEESD